MNKYSCLLYGSMLLFVFSSSLAEPCKRNKHGYCAHGWSWYDEIEKKDARTIEAITLKKMMGSSPDPIVRLKTFKRNFEFLKNRAVIDPSFNHVLASRKAEVILMQLAMQYADMRMRVNRMHPEIMDNTLPNGDRMHDSFISKKADEIIIQKAKTYLNTNGRSVMFFYKASCPHCQKMAPVVSSLAKKMGMPFKAVSLDGKTLPQLPDTITNPTFALKESARLGLKSIPVTVLFKRDGTPITMIKGGASESSLIETFAALAPSNTKRGDE